MEDLATNNMGFNSIEPNSMNTNSINTNSINTNSINTVDVQNNALTFDEKVIKKIVGFSTNEVPGILAMSGNFIAGLTDKLRNTDDPTKGISVEMGKQQVSVSMKVICEYGRNIPAIFQDIVEKVSGAVKEMTGLEVFEVKVHVYDILMKEEFERQSKKKTEEKAEMAQEKAEKEQEKPKKTEEIEKTEEEQETPTEYPDFLENI